MSEQVQQIAVLLVFALVLMFVNLKSGNWLLKWGSYLALIACLIGAAFLTVDWMVLS